jgi:hypothetical protein
MLTFKATLHDTQVAFDQAVDRREDFIHNLLAVYADRSPRWAVNIVEALNNLSTAQADVDAFEHELLRLEHIEDITDEIADPFPPPIAKRLRSMGLSDEDMRELANEMLADENGGPEAMRFMHMHADENGGPETMRSPPLKASFMHMHEDELPEPGGTGDVEPPMSEEWLKPACQFCGSHDLYVIDMGGPWFCVACGRRQDDNLARRHPQRLVDLLNMADDDRPSLHGDGHVGPVAQHAARASRETTGFSIHDLLEALTDPSPQLTKRTWLCPKYVYKYRTRGTDEKETFIRKIKSLFKN